jgi:hypothetical protein
MLAWLFILHSIFSDGLTHAQSKRGDFHSQFRTRCLEHHLAGEIMAIVFATYAPIRSLSPEPGLGLIPW